MFNDTTATKDHLRPHNAITNRRECCGCHTPLDDSFKPGGNPDVDKIKVLYAQIIDFCNDMRSSLPEAKTSDDAKRLSEKARFLSVAITEAQTAQMWAVKAITK
jgi:hypothetical protein